jgi:hypothetical protein
VHSITTRWPRVDLKSSETEMLDWKLAEIEAIIKVNQWNISYFSFWKCQKDQEVVENTCIKKMSRLSKLWTISHT